MSSTVQINENVFVPAAAIRVVAVRSSGPGGQNVNKVSSKIDLRVDLDAVVGLSLEQHARLLTLARTKLDAEGRLFVTSQLTRDQQKNLGDALDKVRALIEASLILPKKRKPTKPSRAVKRRRVEGKRLLAKKKESRRGGESAD